MSKISRHFKKEMSFGKNNFRRVRNSQQHTSHSWSEKQHDTSDQHETMFDTTNNNESNANDFAHNSKTSKYVLFLLFESFLNLRKDN